MCGENGGRKQRNLSRPGSPPRVRGKQGRGFPHQPQGGITPACAGKTFDLPDGEDDKRDHPRVCGENDSVAVKKSCRAGSPPRVRGKPGSKRYSLEKCGITPACAGKTLERAMSYDGARDHPRVCGENRFAYAARPSVAGSPPRVRGKHFGNGVFPWLILVLSLDPL